MNSLVPQVSVNAARMRGRALSFVSIGLAALVLGGIGWGVIAMVGRGDSGSATGALSSIPSWYEVRKQNLELVIVSSGELETKRKVDIKCEVEGNTTIVEVVNEGVFVKEGDVIMRLADDDIRTRMEQELLNLEQAKSDFDSAQQQLAIEQNDADSKLRAAMVTLEMSKLDKAKWENGDDPQKVRELNLALEKAKRTLTRDQRDLELSKQLYEQKFISLSELEDDQIAVIESENALKTATQAIEIYNNYTRPKELQKLESDLTRATEELEATKYRAEININRAKSTLTSRTRSMTIRQERYRKLEDQLKATVIIAPQDGMVVYGTTVGGRRNRSEPISQGRQVNYNELLIVLPDTRQMVASVKINESFMPMIRVGQKATVKSDFNPGVLMEGTVSTIGVMAEDGGWYNPDVREYSVKIDLQPGLATDLKPAMRCSANIMVGKLEDVLAVPLQAVITESKQQFVFVHAPGDKVQRRYVTIGKNNESLVEIKSGLEEGDEVLLRRPRPGELVNPNDAAPDPNKKPDGPGADKAAQGRRRPEGGAAKPVQAAPAQTPEQSPAKPAEAPAVPAASSQAKPAAPAAASK